MVSLKCQGANQHVGRPIQGAPDVLFVWLQWRQFWYFRCTCNGASPPGCTAKRGHWEETKGYVNNTAGVLLTVWGVTIHAQ